MTITPKNWGSFQHYKNRLPPWIKLHHALLDNIEFHCLPVASRALAPCLWLLASEYEGGRITLSTKGIAFRLRCSETEIIEALKPLINEGFFTSDSTMLANCKQDAMPEERREEERREKENHHFSSGGGSLSQEERREKKSNGSARSFASAPDEGALAREPSNHPAEPKPVAEKKPGLYRKPTDDEANDYRSPPPRKSDNVLEPIPDRPPMRRPNDPPLLPTT